jgi:hypothetical protein
MLFYLLLVTKRKKICKNIHLNQSQKMSFDKDCHFYVETCFLLIFENVSVFYYNDNGLDGMCGCHSIWRRWGRYQGEGLEEMSFFICIKLAFFMQLRGFFRSRKR